jgi:DNA-binding transcriptional MerR regulator
MANKMESAGPSERSKVSKAAGAFRTISEVSRELDVPQHVLRFWESKFTQVSPLKRGGGRRYYRPEDIRLLERIRDLLYVDGFTIKGVQKLIKEQGVKALLEPPAENSGPVANAPSPAPQPAVVAKDERRAIMTAIAELSEIRKLLTVSTS